jgi:hypothetical protein
MVQRRTRALTELVISALLLTVLVRIWKSQFNNAGKQREPHPVLPTALATGALNRAAGHWASDNDIAGIRTNWRRRTLFTVRWKIQNILIQRYASDPDMFQYNYNIGTLIGTIGYRVWYGLLHPLSGKED